MPKTPGRKLDTRIVVVVAAAGLLSGAILAYHLTNAPSRSQAEATDEVLQEHRVPWDELHPEAAQGQAGPAQGAGEAAEPADSGAPPDRTGEDERAIIGAQERAEQQGVQGYVELDDHLYLKISVQLVIAAAELQHHKDAKDLLVDYTAQVLAEERVDPETFEAYTRQIAENPQRAAAVSERILREAEKRTHRRIKVDPIPGLPATELDIKPEQAD